MKKTYIVTETAGRDVAGQPSPGVDQPIRLTAAQAEHPLRLGYIRLPTDHDGDGKPGGSKKAR